MAEQVIVSDPEILLGKPVVSGTRISVEHILERLGAGESVEALIEAHPRLTRQGVEAALTYAARVLACEDVHLVPDIAV